MVLGHGLCLEWWTAVTRQLIDSPLSLFVAWCAEPSGNWGHRNQFECAPWNQTWPERFDVWRKTILEPNRLTVVCCKAVRGCSFFRFRVLVKCVGLGDVWGQADWFQIEPQSDTGWVQNLRAGIYFNLEFSSSGAELRRAVKSLLNWKYAQLWRLSPLCCIFPRCPWSRDTLCWRIGESVRYQNNLIKTLADTASPADCSNAYLSGINRHLSVSLLNRRSASVHWVMGR